jgi:hypothetical protein
MNTVQILPAIVDGLIFSKERNHGRRSIICLNEKQVALKDKDLWQVRAGLPGQEFYRRSMSL